jgi:hypothetical protein
MFGLGNRGGGSGAKGAGSPNQATRGFEPEGSLPREVSRRLDCVNLVGKSVKASALNESVNSLERAHPRDLSQRSHRLHGQHTEDELFLMR